MASPNEDGYWIDRDEQGNTRINYSDFMAVKYDDGVRMQPVEMSISWIEPMAATRSMISQLEG